ncbi:uroporphyrinogen decarboxylase [Candidatus Pelagibacter communis]|uniref:uroporphyrinogen decarboxylase n=1 Tax=Pelagibacter ubique TaxID=198252 RepID=UPI00094DDFBE|nr:uroporphyrinogen decarboxylase [Candidatus Pelagibacter ubique]|tara:strand:- start:2497 stop:3498 length:1002 start_codon:yes stop_codon:yes gene_type:complete
MTPITKVIVEKDTKINPIWIMRQAGRYLPEFREIRKQNQNFINLCLNKELSAEITLQPLKRFNLDAAIIFSDILILPYGLNQKVEFKKDFGPLLGELDLNQISKIDEIDFVQKILPVYKAINLVSNHKLTKNKNTIGFVGAPWTLLVYMINQQSPKKKLKDNFFKDEFLINRILLIIEKFLKIHIKNQIDNGANIIQIFDSWAGLLEEKDLPNYVYSPTLNLVNYVKSLNTPVICFPREIKNYKEFCDIIKPDVINIDYNVNPKEIIRKIEIPIQGGLDPKVLLTDKETLKKEAIKYLDIFKDHPYIFNLGHGVLPETNPEMVEYLIKIVKEY